MIQAASANKGTGIVASIIGVATLLFAASGVFGELQDALDTIWEVQPKPGLGFMATIKKRFFSFGMVLGLGDFDVLDLDTPLLLSTDPVIGGYRYHGPQLQPWKEAGLDMQAAAPADCLTIQ